ncbi:hypothetical protein GQ42DRAFT_163661 [Ramicandelaber brevisporus]|nr:hypothetical protein GQ42DRAFT_163661 [Ramicandelaber brevisporus]
MTTDQCQEHKLVDSVFEIASLPLDLQLYLTNFFICSEAAKVLTVSQLFHDIFSRAVWYKMQVRHIIRSTRQIPASAMERYGHLVKFLDINNDYYPIEDLVRWMPKASTIKYGVQYYKPTPFYIQELEKLSGFGNLKRLCLYMTNIDLSIAVKVVEWLNDYSRSGHISIVYMGIEVPHAPPGLWRYLTRSVDDLRRIRADLDLDIKDLIVDKNVLQVTAATTVYVISQKRFDTSCYGMDLGGMFGDRTLSFSWLKWLELVVCCADKEKYDFIGFTPDRFPSLKGLDYNQRNLECCKEHGCPTRRIFSNQWPSITQLTLLDTLSSDDAAYVLDAVPKLSYLIYWHNSTSGEAEGGGYDLGLLAVKLPLLQRLRTMSQKPIRFSLSNEATGLAGYQNIRLHYMELDLLEISEALVRFILQGCPVLRRLDIETCTISQDALQCAMDIGKSTPSSLRIYSLSAILDKSADSGIIDFAAAFVNLETFHIKYLNAVDKKTVNDRYSHLNIT